MLTHLEVLAIKPACKESYKHKDARGFHFYRHPTAESIYARLKYKINGKEKVFTLGTYGEDFTLQESFKMAKDLRYKIDNDGFDPLADKQAAKIASKTAAENTFAVVAERWLRKNKSEWTSESYYRQQRYRVERHLNPILGAMPFADIKPRNIAIALEKLEDRKKLSQAKKCSQIIDGVMLYGAKRGLRESVPVSMTDELESRKGVPNPALPESELPDFLRAIDEKLADTSRSRAALLVLMLTGLRVGALVGARWEWYNAEAKTLTVPREAMKGRTSAFVVPLPHQVVTLLEEQPRTSPYIFPSNGSGKSGHTSRSTLAEAVKRCGYHNKQSLHGLRSVFSTAMNSRNPADAFMVERCLGHRIPGMAGAYNFATYDPQRAELLQRWSDVVDTLRAER